MILRGIVLALTLANLGMYGWTQGWFGHADGVASSDSSQLQAQVHPELMKVAAASATSSTSGAAAAASGPVPAASVAVAASAASTLASQPLSDGARAAASGVLASVEPASSGVAAAASASAASAGVPALLAASAVAGASSASSSGASQASAASAPTFCLESGPYVQARDAGVVEKFLKANVPQGSWQRSGSERVGVWMVYMGRYVDNEARKRKEGELERRHVEFKTVDQPPEFARGLSLGEFSSRPEADAALAELNRQGVRTARVVVLSPPSTSQTFRVDQADAALAAKLRGAKLPQPFTDCKI